MKRAGIGSPIGQESARFHANLCAKFRRGQKSNVDQQARDQHFCALGGIRTPNLLIRRRVPPSQWVPPVPPEYNDRG
jgi:hypothetical protein